MATRRRRFDKQFKLDAMRLIEESDRPITDVARELGVNVNLLYRWRNTFSSDAEEAFPGNGKLKASDSELARLRRELELVTEERDILKKALAVFSRRVR